MVICWWLPDEPRSLPSRNVQSLGCGGPDPDLVREAGGHFLDWDGRESFETGNGISVNAALEDEVLVRRPVAQELIRRGSPVAESARIFG